MYRFVGEAKNMLTVSLEVVVGVRTPIPKCKVLVITLNCSSRSTCCGSKLFIFDETVCKKLMEKQINKRFKYEHKMNVIPQHIYLKYPYT